MTLSDDEDIRMLERLIEILDEDSDYRDHNETERLQVQLAALIERLKKK